jgi:hypothetical protein
MLRTNIHRSESRRIVASGAQPQQLNDATSHPGCQFQDAIDRDAVVHDAPSTSNCRRNPARKLRRLFAVQEERGSDGFGTGSTPPFLRTIKYSLLSAKNLFATWIGFPNRRLKRIVDVDNRNERFKIDPQITPLRTVKLPKRTVSCESSDYP